MGGRTGLVDGARRAGRAHHQPRHHHRAHVLGRLERKGLVTRERDGRAHRYRAVGSREDHVAELMNDALGTAADRTAALARFVGSIPPEERARLRDLLN